MRHLQLRPGQQRVQHCGVVQWALQEEVNRYGQAGRCRCQLHERLRVLFVHTGDMKAPQPAGASAARERAPDARSDGCVQVVARQHHMDAGHARRQRGERVRKGVGPRDEHAIWWAAQLHALQRGEAGAARVKAS